MEEKLTLREYIDMRFTEQEKSVAAALAAADRAVNKAEVATEKRFEAVNEFRAALSDAARLLMPRAEAEAALRVLSEKVEDLSQRLLSRQERGSGMSQTWLIVVSVVSAASAVVMMIYSLWRAK